MDASQYKDYVLVLLFVKYVSDKYAGQPYAPITIPAGASFADMVALKGTTDIGDQINKKVLGPLASSRVELVPKYKPAVGFSVSVDPDKLRLELELMSYVPTVVPAAVFNVRLPVPLTTDSLKTITILSVTAATADEDGVI
jgi:hypothetical protein